MKSLALACLSVMTLASCAPACVADTLKGSTVRGVLNVEGSSTNDFSPAKATVGPGLEFNAVESAFPFMDTCEYTANLSASRIVIEDVCGGSVVSEDSDAVTALKNPKAPFTMTFTDMALAGDTLTALTNNLDLKFSLTGDVLTFSLDDADPTGNTSSFAVGSAVTPEPASLQLLCLGLAAAMATFSRPRFNA